MGVGLFERLADGVGETAHPGLTVPEPPRQRPSVVKDVLLDILRHVRPVEAATVLAPADDLLDEALGCCQGYASARQAASALATTSRGSSILVLSANDKSE